MIKVDDYTVLHLDCYKGIFYVVEGYSKDDAFKPRWVTEEWGKEKTPKTMPKRIKLGDKASAIKAAIWMLEKLEGGDDAAPF